MKASMNGVLLIDGQFLGIAVSDVINTYTDVVTHLNKYETMTQCRANVGPASQTVGQR